PRPIPQLHVADLGEPETAPLAAARQAGPAPAAKLKSQRLLLPLRMAEDDRAELTGIAAVHAQNLLSLVHGPLEQSVGPARHRNARCVRAAGRYADFAASSTTGRASAAPSISHSRSRSSAARAAPSTGSHPSSDLG